MHRTFLPTTSQEGFECITAKEQLRIYCPNVYTVVKGDSEIICEIVDDSYTFSGLPNMDPIEKANFKPFWVDFRSNVEKAGGPESISNEFMIFKNVIRREVRP